MRTGEVLSRLTTDIALVETLLTTSVSFALRNFLTMIGGIVLLFIVSPKLTGLVLLVVPVLLGPIFLFGRTVRKLTVASQDRFANAVGFAGESVDAIETVQAFGREASAIARFGAAVEAAFGVSLVRMRARALMTAMIIVVMFGGVTLVLWLGAQDVIQGRMTPGALLQFVLLSVFAAGAVGALGESCEVPAASQEASEHGACAPFWAYSGAEPTCKQQFSQSSSLNYDSHQSNVCHPVRWDTLPPPKLAVAAFLCPAQP
jgi:ATP-binding cassette subfamily B protein